MKLVIPTYVDDGDEVIAPYDNKGTGIKCKVIHAHGYYAYVGNDKYEFYKMFHIDNLRINVS
ncbi:MAG TPA: hypothetical protein VMX17_12745 [Candidatus Glassbacteria bacterium]|nr:hypothetical protein [Candidatus Glassbacteria bacterium]